MKSQVFIIHRANCDKAMRFILSNSHFVCNSRAVKSKHFCLSVMHVIHLKCIKVCIKVMKKHVFFSLQNSCVQQQSGSFCSMTVINEACQEKMCCILSFICNYFPKLSRKLVLSWFLFNSCSFSPKFVHCQRGINDHTAL